MPLTPSKTVTENVDHIYRRKIQKMNYKLTKYLKQNTWRYIIASLAMVCSVSLDVLLPAIIAAIVDKVIIGGHMELLTQYLIAIVIVGLARAIFQYVKELLFDMSGCNVAENMRKDLLGHIQTLSKNFFDSNNTGELMARVKDDEGRVWDMTGFCGMLIVEATIYLIGVIIAMLKMNWQLALIPIVFLPFLGVLVMRLEKKLDDMYGAISEENAVLTKTIEENISGVRTVKAFAAEEFEMKKFDKHNSDYNELNIRQARFMANMEPLIGFLPKAMQILVLCVGGYYAMNGKISYGVMIAFLQYSGNIIWPIENMGWLTNMFASGIASYKKIKKVFAAQPQITEKEDAISRESLAGTLAFNNVSFSLNDNEILKDISFTLAPGKTLGIMGATGAGKTTVVNLIQRFYDTTEGTVTLDNIDLRDLTLRSVRDYSSVVTQDIFLFSDTIKENVKLGKKATMSDHAVVGALDKAHASEFVNRITGGYDAVIGERGIGLSGGQKQRLSIARAMARKAGVLIMDDSTSALDMETEADIQKELYAKKDMSKIIIAHRISSVKDADEIIVLDKGTIAERGTHSELIAARGKYYATYEAQFGSLANAVNAMGGEN